MKKSLTLGVTLLTALSLAACGNSQAKSDKAKKDSSSLVAKKKAHAKKESIKKAKAASESKAKAESESKASSIAANSSSAASVVASQSQAAQSSSAARTQKTTQSKSQGEINRERGYDPNGNKLLPGQDHAAGSNPDGTADSWVQGQLDWAVQNGYENPDGSNTAKGQQAEDEVNANADSNNTGDPNDGY